VIPFLGGAANPPILCKARLGTGCSARTQKRPYTHGRIFLAGGRFEPGLFSRPRSACLCGCNGPALELGRAGWLAEARLEGEDSRPDLEISERSDPTASLVRLPDAPLYCNNEKSFCDTKCRKIDFSFTVIYILFSINRYTKNTPYNSQ
jgi:hypothetical protein